MGRYLEGDRAELEILLQKLVDGLLGDAGAVLAEEERAVGDGGLALVALEGGEGGTADRDDAFLGALAEDADVLAEEVDVLYVEPAELGNAEAAGVEELEDGGIAQGHPGLGLFVDGNLERQGEQLVDLGEVEDDRELLFGLGELDFGDRALGVAAAVDEELVEGADGGEAEADGGLRQALLHHIEEPAVEVVGRGVAPAGEGIAEPGAAACEGEPVIDEGARGGAALDFHEAEEVVLEIVIHRSLAFSAYGRGRRR